ncbi:MAG: ROK family protein [Ktedonobacteraceae bacterium]|nr:ROK family protein [Ktedonobacteraceae bacterium]MBO0794150.1 ROK family protein [Ktedonobacteraceae bacterium]
MSRDTSVAVSVEIGGERTTVALIDQQGRVRHRCHAKTLRGRPATATLEPYLRSIDTMLVFAREQGWPVQGIGMSLPGSLEQTTRRPLTVSLLPSLNNFPLQDLLESRYHLPAHLNSDVDAAMLGEQCFGAGRGFRRLLFLTVSAVVGAAFVVDGQFERSTQYVGHVCHLSVTASGPRCSCGKRGCINTLVSTDALQKMVQRAVRRGDETSLTRRLLNREYFSPQLLAEEAARGDSVSLQIYGEVGRWLGAAVNKYVDLFEPHVLILGGGGVLYAADLVLSQVRSTLGGQSSARVCSMVEVVPACLGRDAALVGAAVPLL